MSVEPSDRGRNPENEDRAGRLPALVFDPKEYVDYVLGHELSETEQRQLMQTVWQVMLAFVDLGFGIHPVQQAMGPQKEDVSNRKAVLDHESAVLVSFRRTITPSNEEKAVTRRGRRVARRKDS